MTLVLGIESSCDETAVAVVDASRRIRANIIRTQYEQHAPYGGVVPEIAARAHLEWMEPILAEALQTAGCGLADLDAIAVTAGPGLIGGVIVGVMTAKTLASIARKPLIAVNHLEGHALTPRLSDNVPFPYLLLLVSGGHCFYAIARDVGEYELLGGTKDDALGEAFDKCAKMMGLPYPGGPQVEKLAAEGDALAYALPRPLMGTPGCDFSFSGLKTAVRYTLDKLGADGTLSPAGRGQGEGDSQRKPADRFAPSTTTPSPRPLPRREREITDRQRADMAASFQRAVLDIVRERTVQAIGMAAARGLLRLPLVIAGGVAANRAIGNMLRELASAHEMHFVAPPPALCTDNAAMIAWAGLERFRKGLVDGLDVEPRARWPLGVV